MIPLLILELASVVESPLTKFNIKLKDISIGNNYKPHILDVMCVFVKMCRIRIKLIDC